ncbi:MAG: helix-turn-helix transcriptional regulator [Eggerthellaceae bacterium]|nr:helix-turn-helix transcriptional regulator [Eggerthellaceae bacterium]
MSTRSAMPLLDHASLGLEEAYILGYNVERLRRQRGMDVSTFARVAGITRPTVYKMERGEADPKLSYVRKVADALGVSVVDLLTPPPEVLDPSFYQRACAVRAQERKDRAGKRSR